MMTDETATDTSDSTPTRMPLRRFLAGLLGLLVAFGASVVLSLDALLEGFEIPGCGLAGGCARASASMFGKVPGLGWPTSFVGMAFFAALLVTWGSALTNGRPGPVARWVARLGGVGSVLFVTAMSVGGYFCPYCIAAHLGNAIFLASLEWPRRGTSGTDGADRLGTLAAVVTFAVVTTMQAVTQGVVDRRAGEHAAQQQEESIDEIVRRGQTNGESPDEAASGRPFTGRYRLGPEKASIRIVIVSDFQCPECKAADMEVRRILAERDDVSVSHKNFPICTQCNSHATRNMHPNACAAALAAEAAGILRGNEGYWKMHEWLFDNGGTFDNELMNRTLTEMGYDAVEFKRVMQDGKTLARVHADIEEAIELGLHTTPMIFVNGVEMMGWRPQRSSLLNSVRRLARSNPEPRTAEVDLPPNAIEKAVLEFRLTRPQRIAQDTFSWPLLPASTGEFVDVVIWGDYQEPNTANADRCIRAAADRRGDVRYTFRHFPINKSCNPSAPSTKFAQSCLAAAAASAAGHLNDAEGYWAMHDWLMSNQGGVNEAALRRAAPTLGLDADALMSGMTDGVIATDITEDARAAWMFVPRMGGNFSIPLVFVDGRLVFRWSQRGNCVLGQIIDAAAEQKGGGR